MGLHRLYWIPAGLPASEGVYVRYRPHELYAVLCLESQRHQTTIIGENLGTVPPAVNDSLDRHGIRRMFVVQYELHPSGSQPLAGVPNACIASLNTHDMPTFAAWWRGADIASRQKLDLLSEDEARDEQRRLGKPNLNCSPGCVHTVGSDPGRHDETADACGHPGMSGRQSRRKRCL